MRSEHRAGGVAKYMCGVLQAWRPDLSVNCLHQTTTRPETPCSDSIIHPDFIDKATVLANGNIKKSNVKMSNFKTNGL